ncbi:hypothetical protein [Tindallia magadiensis]|uniref:hypothetical protein n=1 Tax=Tindallia magadiensis TaxID=69895 RepID=UPI001160CFF3|nr:hypothetical protein [Tindallia magadiensis]
MNIKKRIALCIIATSVLVIIAGYYKSIQVGDLIGSYTDQILTNTDETLPDRINSHIYFSAYSEKELEVTSEKSIKEIVSLLSDMEVRRLLNPPDSWGYRPQLKSTYRLNLYYESDKTQTINILNSKYIRINHNTYKIIGYPDLAYIYEIIISAQPKGTLDEFYYEIIDMDL